MPGGLSGVIAVAAGEAHNLALKQDGTVVAWGYNYYGQATVPPELSATRVIAIAAGYADSFAVKEDGTVVVWGVWGAVHNNGTLPPATVPSDLGGVIAVAAGGEHSLALKQDGTVAAWGLNSYGQTNVPPGLSGPGLSPSPQDLVITWPLNRTVPSLHGAGISLAKRTCPAA